MCYIPDKGYIFADGTHTSCMLMVNDFLGAHMK